MSPCADDNISDGPPSIISTGRVYLADQLPSQDFLNAEIEDEDLLPAITSEDESENRNCDNQKNDSQFQKAESEEKYSKPFRNFEGRSRNFNIIQNFHSTINYSK